MPTSIRLVSLFQRRTGTLSPVAEREQGQVTLVERRGDHLEEVVGGSGVLNRHVADGLVRTDALEQFMPDAGHDTRTIATAASW